MLAESFAPILESYAQRYLERLPVANGEDPWVEAKEGSLASWVMSGLGFGFGMSVFVGWLNEWECVMAK